MVGAVNGVFVDFDAEFVDLGFVNIVFVNAFAGGVVAVGVLVSGVGHADIGDASGFAGIEFVEGGLALGVLAGERCS